LLQAILADPSVVRVDWLDLACGRGQIVVALEENLSAAARAKIVYHAFDAEQKYLREAEKTALRLGLAGVHVKLGDVRDFNSLAGNSSYDFVTFTNTAHEVRPAILAELLVDVVLSLTPHGCLFMYDMEFVNPPELGAIPWSSAEFVALATTLVSEFGATTYEPAIGRWRHSSTVGWNVQIHRHHLSISDDDARARRDQAVVALRDKMNGLLHAKLAACSESLESITRFGVETPDEEQEKVRQLYNFWSLKRATESGNV